MVVLTKHNSLKKVYSYLTVYTKNELIGKGREISP